MPTNFPTSVDNFTNPTANDSLNLPSHSTQHANANDAIEAVEDYLLNGAGRNGLIHINTTAFNSQSTVDLTNVFSSSYLYYRILIHAFKSGSIAFYTRLLNSSNSPITAANYTRNAIYSSGGGAVAASYGAGTDTIDLFNAYGAERHVLSFDVLNPYAATNTDIVGAGGNSGANVLSFHHSLNSSDVCAGIRFYVTSGDITGRVSVYGYR